MNLNEVLPPAHPPLCTPRRLQRHRQATATGSAEDPRRQLESQLVPGKIETPTPEQAQKHMEQAQAALRELKLDILLLQEVRDWQAAEELCSVVPGLQVQVVSRFQPRPQNQVIATTLPVDSGWSADWNHSNDGPPRGYTFAAIELLGKRFLLTYSLHLKSNVGAPVPNVMKRQESAKQLLRHTDEMLDLYSPGGACFFVVGGDMNTSLNELRWNSSAHSLQSSAQGSGGLSMECPSLLASLTPRTNIQTRASTTSSHWDSAGVAFRFKS